METVNILLIAVLVLLCIGFICMYIIFIKFVREILIEHVEHANKIKSIDKKIDYIDTKLNLTDNKMQELNKTIYEIYDGHIKVIENYTKYCATSIARKHKDNNKHKTNTKQQ